MKKQKRILMYGAQCTHKQNERERESLFFCQYTYHRKKKNDYTYSSNSTVTHNTMICAQLQEAPKNRQVIAGTPRGGAEGVIARGPGDTEGPWVQNCQNRMQNYGLRTPLVYLGGAIVLCTPPPLTLLFSKK